MGEQSYRIARRRVRAPGFNAAASARAAVPAAT